MQNETEAEILTNSVERLVNFIYHELKDREIRISLAKLHSYAEVRWSDEGNPISIKCDKTVLGWHDAALTGLLAHELSHPSLKSHNTSENQTDLDVIQRGLGVFLAFERVISGRYTDVLVNRGRDRYLGYKTLREQLNIPQKKQLDRLMENQMLKPSKRKSTHDSIIIDKTDRMVLSIGGQILECKKIRLDADIKFIIRESKTYIYADDELIGQLDTEL